MFKKIFTLILITSINLPSFRPSLQSLDSAGLSETETSRQVGTGYAGDSKSL